MKDQPESVGRDFIPDQVVAGAAIVAATALGGDQCLQALVASDPALDARLPTPPPGLAGAALDSVADRWRQERSKDADGAEASQTIAALSQVLAHVGAVDDPRPDLG